MWYNLTAPSLSFLCVLCWLLQLAADLRVCLSAPAIIGAPHATTAHHQHALGESPRTPRQRVSADRSVSRTPTPQRTPQPTAVRILAHAAQLSSAETPHWPSAAVLSVVRVRGCWDVRDGCGLVLVIAQPSQAASRASHSARPATHNGAYQTNKLSPPPPSSHSSLLSPCRLHRSRCRVLCCSDVIGSASPSLCHTSNRRCHFCHVLYAARRHGFCPLRFVRRASPVAVRCLDTFLTRRRRHCPCLTAPFQCSLLLL